MTSPSESAKTVRHRQSGFARPLLQYQSQVPPSSLRFSECRRYIELRVLMLPLTDIRPISSASSRRTKNCIPMTDDDTSKLSNLDFLKKACRI